MARRENHRGNTGPKRTRHSRQDRTRSSSDPQDRKFNSQQIDDFPGEEFKPFRPNERNFNILVDSVPYMVTAVPFSFNGETRYRVRFNGSQEHVFTWDSSLRQLRAINDDSSTIPDNLEIAISEKLQSLSSNE